MEECQKHGVVVGCKKYGIYPAICYNWVRKFKSMGAEGLQHGMTKEYLKESRRLEHAHARLKDPVVQKELESSMKDELLRKSTVRRSPANRSASYKQTQGKDRHKAVCSFPLSQCHSATFLP